jgi:hypothetical protein
MALVDNTDANESASQVTGAGGSVANDIILYHYDIILYHFVHPSDDATVLVLTASHPPGWGARDR